MSCCSQARRVGSVRRILVATANRAERGLLEPVMAELDKRNDVIAEWFEWVPTVECERIENALDERMSLFDPDIILIPCDRNEMVYAAAYAFHHNRIVAHFHAGNNPSNHPDDINRRVISCFSHIIFCNMLEHKRNLIRQREEPWRIHVVGSTAFDHIELNDAVTPKEPFDLVILHPNPLSEEKTRQDLVDVMGEICIGPKVVWIYPNHDQNYEIIEKFIIDKTDDSIVKYRNLPRNQYLSLLKNCTRAIGNSSSFYYEMPILDSTNKLIQIGERNKGLKVPKTVVDGSVRITKILATVEINDRLRRKRFTV